MFSLFHRLFLLDEAWRHAALEGAVSEQQMQNIDECMQEVAAQMQTQMKQQQNDDKLEQFENQQCTVHNLNGVQNAEGDVHDSETLNCRHKQSAYAPAAANDVLFQVLSVFGITCKEVRLTL
jgi:hypothetical protein